MFTKIFAEGKKCYVSGVLTDCPALAPYVDVPGTGNQCGAENVIVSEV
jgi:hypothetical protein